MPVGTTITALSYVVAIVSIFGISTVIATTTNDKSKNFSGLIPNRNRPKTIEANVIIEGGNKEDGTIAIGEKLKAIVVVNEANNITNFKLSWIDADSGKLVADEKLLDKTCAIFEENNTEVAEGCSLTYEIQKGDENKTIKAQVDFFNDKGEIISTVLSNQTRKVIFPPTINTRLDWLIFGFIILYFLYLLKINFSPTSLVWANYYINLFFIIVFFVLGGIQLYIDFSKYMLATSCFFISIISLSIFYKGWSENPQRQKIEAKVFTESVGKSTETKNKSQSLNGVGTSTTLSNDN